jgi:hypothetical protein
MRVKVSLLYYGKVRLMKIFGPKREKVTGDFRTVPKIPLERQAQMRGYC